MMSDDYTHGDNLADPMGDFEELERDFFRKGIETITGQRYEIQRLNERIKSLEDGACRFHCRMRKDMWKAGYKDAIANQDIGGDIPEDADEAYNEWRKE